MSANGATLEALAPAGRTDAGAGAVYRVEVRKITAQLLPRAAALICLLGPFAFAIFIRTQSSVPADWLFGRWVQASGFALPFLFLGPASYAGHAGSRPMSITWELAYPLPAWLHRQLARLAVA